MENESGQCAPQAQWTAGIFIEDLPKSSAKCTSGFSVCDARICVILFPPTTSLEATSWEVVWDAFTVYNLHLNKAGAVNDHAILHNFSR